MSLERLLNHQCDIYHLQEAPGSPGYGLPESPVFSYLPDPDIHNLKCHFASARSQNVTIIQTAPANIMEARIKLTLPAGTDVRLNDKIVDCTTGLEYTAEQPVDVRGHHTFVYVKKTEGQKTL